MVSRSTGPLRTILPAAAVGLAALLVGCSAGQVTQTASIRPAVNGNQADLGQLALRDVMLAYPEGGEYRAGDQAPLVLSIVNTGNSDDELVSVSSPAAADVQLVGTTNVPGGTALKVIAPEEPVGESSAPSETSDATSESAPPTESSLPDESITEPQPPADTATGTTSSEESAPPQTESSDSTATETPTSLAPDEIGVVSIVLTGLVQDLPMGRNVPVTFVFADAGSVTIQLPIAAPETARQDPPENEEDGEH
jgi:copper(I)-binding protein